MPGGNPPPEWIYWLVGAQCLTWLIAVGSWFWADYSNNQREKRKETRALIDALVESIDALRDKAITYYTTEVGDQSKKLETEIKIGFQRISFAADVASKRLKLDVLDQLSNFMGAVTGQQFETKNRKPLPFDHVNLIGMAYEADKLVVMFEKKFGEVFYK